MMGPLGYPVTIGEFFGGLGLVVGFLSRFSAASLIVIMLGAIGMVHGKNGFFLGTVPIALLLLPASNTTWPSSACLLPILIAGPGKFAIGRFLPLPKSAADGPPDRGLGVANRPRRARPRDRFSDRKFKSRQQCSHNHWRDWMLRISRGNRTAIELFLDGLSRWPRSLIAACQPLMMKSGV